MQAVIPVSPAALAAALQAALAAQPRAIVKLGMLPDAASVHTVARLLAGRTIVADPVLGPSAGGSWADAEWINTWRTELAPLLTVVTPNLTEARRLVALPQANAVQAAAALRELGCATVIITGSEQEGQLCGDYFASASGNWWLTGQRLPGTARGTGCCFAAGLSAALAHGDTVATAAVAGRIQATARVAGAPAGLPTAQWLPWLSPTLPTAPPPACAPLPQPLGVCALVAAAGAITPLAGTGIGSVQLRLAPRLPTEVVTAQIQAAQVAAAAAKLPLFINDYWHAALAAPVGSVAGVHLGQEDLRRADVAAINAAGLCLGVSAHNWHEAAVALAAGPSYLSFGPVFATTSKQLDQPPLGLELLTRLCTGTAVPTLAIGGITAANAAQVAATGVAGIAAIAATATPAHAAELVAAWRSN